jgi:hypothetical protein
MMAGKQGKSKATRKPKSGMGIHGGGGKVRLTELQKVLLGGGMYRTMAAVGQGRHDRIKVESRPKRTPAPAALMAEWRKMHGQES